MLIENYEHISKIASNVVDSKIRLDHEIMLRLEHMCMSDLVWLIKNNKLNPIQKLKYHVLVNTHSVVLTLIKSHKEDKDIKDWVDKYVVDINLESQQETKKTVTIKKARKSTKSNPNGRIK